MSEGDVELLRELGLSNDAASIYVLLVKSPGRLSFEEVSALSKLPSDRAQRSLRELVDEGFVEVERNLFSAVQPKLALTALLERKEEKFRRESERIGSVVSLLRRSLEVVYWETRAGIRPEELTETLEDLSAMEVRTVRAIGNAEKEVLIFTWTFDWYDKVREVLMQALDRGAEAKVLMRVEDEASSRRARELLQLGVKVRRSVEDWYPVRGTLVDREELVFLIWATRKDVAKPIYFRPHYTRNPGLIKIFLDAFEKRWEKAKEISAAS